MKTTFAAVVAALLFAAPASAASLNATVSLQRAGDNATIEVKLTSARPFTAKTKPKSVKVGSIKLSRVSQKRKVSTWRSAPRPAAQIEALAGKKVSIKVTTRAGTRTVRGNAGALPPAPKLPGQTTPAPPAPAPGTIGQAQLTRNDAAGQAAMAGGDLLLEWASFGASGRTAEYRRIWFYADGSFRQNFIDWNDVSGEICNHSLTGTWTFKEGYTTDYGGGGVVVKLGFAFSNGQSGDDLIGFPNGNSKTVYVGAQGTLAYERNPQIMQNC
jgi:hypothetical protein